MRSRNLGSYPPRYVILRQLVTEHRIKQPETGKVQVIVYDEQWVTRFISRHHELSLFIHSRLMRFELEPHRCSVGRQPFFVRKRNFTYKFRALIRGFPHALQLSRARKGGKKIQLVIRFAHTQKKEKIKDFFTTRSLALS